MNHHKTETKAKLQAWIHGDYAFTLKEILKERDETIVAFLESAIERAILESGRGLQIGDFSLRKDQTGIRIQEPTRNLDTVMFGFDEAKKLIGDILKAEKEGTKHEITR